MIVVDTSVIVAYMNRADDHHAEVSAWLEEEGDELVTTPLVIGEADHVVSARGGPAAARALRRDLTSGAYLLEWWPAAINAACRVVDRYADQGLGLTDASLVALAQRLPTTSIATLDERHFRAIRPLEGGDAFRLLPADGETRPPARGRGAGSDPAIVSWTTVMERRSAERDAGAAETGPPARRPRCEATAPSSIGDGRLAAARRLMGGHPEGLPHPPAGS